MAIKHSKSRCLLHRTDLRDLSVWLAKQGFGFEPPKGDYEVLRAQNSDRKWIIVFDRHEGDHVTVRGEDIPWVRDFYAAKKTPSPSAVLKE